MRPEDLPQAVGTRGFAAGEENAARGEAGGTVAGGEACEMATGGEEQKSSSPTPMVRYGG